MAKAWVGIVGNHNSSKIHRFTVNQEGQNDRLLSRSSTPNRDNSNCKFSLAFTFMLLWFEILDR